MTSYRHHAYGPTQKEVCRTNGGTLPPNRCPACRAWTPDNQLRSIMRRLEDWASKRGRI